MSRIWGALAGALAVAAVVWWAARERADEREAARLAGMRVTERVAAEAAEQFEPPPPGALKPLLRPPLEGPPDPNRPTLCSDEHWPDLDAFVRRVGDGEVEVDESIWQQADTGARVGIASWLSKCRQAGRAVRIVGSASGRLLAAYDPDRGYTGAN